MIAYVKVNVVNKKLLYSKVLTFPLDIEKYYEKREGKNYITTIVINSPNTKLEKYMFEKEFDTDFETKINGSTITLKLYNKEIKIYAENNSLIFKSVYKEN